MAHELGHVLGIKHTGDSTRLVFDGGTWSATKSPPDLTAAEREVIRKSVMVLK